MPDEIKIVATLDTADVASGTERISAAVKGMKAQVKAVSEGTEAEEAGESFGDKFMEHFVEHLLIRDAIRQMIEGAVDIAEEAGVRLGELFGTNIKISFKDAMASIGDAVAYFVTAVNPLLNKAAQETGLENIDKIKSDEKERSRLDKLKANPLLETKTPEQLEKEIEAIKKSIANTKIAGEQAKVDIFRNQTNRETGGTAFGAFQYLIANAGGGNGIFSDIRKLKTGGSAAEAGINAADVAADEKKSLAEKNDLLKQKNEELEIAKRKEEELAKIQRSWNEETKKAADEQLEISKRKVEELRKTQRQSDEEDKKAKRELDEQDKRRSENMLKTALAQKEIDKKERRIGIENQISADSKAAKTAGTDLSFDRTQLDHQRATSAVSINGSLYGTNDSAATLVQHAATQVSLLRQIEENTKSLRQQNQELTLQ